MLFCFLHLRAAGWDHPTLPYPTPSLFSRPFLSSSKSCGRRAKGTDDSTLMGKRGNPIPYPLQQGPSKSIAFVPVERTVSLLEADFSICSSKFASFNPSPFLVPLPSYGSLLSLPMNHVSMTTPRTSVERERPEREREDSFVRCPRHSRGLVAWFKQFEACCIASAIARGGREERGERREERLPSLILRRRGSEQRAGETPDARRWEPLEGKRGEGREGRGGVTTTLLLLRILGAVCPGSSLP